MALPLPRAPGFQSMMKEGSRYYRGLDEAVIRNIEACSELCRTLKSAYGPKGLNKMVVNHIEKLFVTSDAGTIVRELQIEHPAAKIIVMAAQRQEQEVGDGTNFVMQLSGALLDKAAELIRTGLKPTEIIDGYELAAAKVIDEYLPAAVLSELKDLRNVEEVLPALKTAIASKQYGNEEFLARLVAKACISILPQSQSSGDLPEEKDISFNVDNIRVCKILGGGVQQSHIVNGMVFKKYVEGAHASVKNAKVAVFNCPIDVAATETKATVLIKNADELVNFSLGEEVLLEQQIKAIADSGANVIVSGAKFGPLGLHYVDKYNMTAVRLMSKFDLKRICRSIGATALLKLRPPTQDELGRCDEVQVDEIGDTPVVVFKMEERKSKIATIVIRGSTDNIMDDVERAIDDGVNVYKMLTRDSKLVAGAGAVELDLDRQVSQFARTLPGLEQYSVAKFAESLRSVAVAIAENAGIKSSEAATVLTAAHGNGNKYAGIDIEFDAPTTLDSKTANLVDLYAAKYWGIKFATNAACTILSVDQIICAKPAQGPKPPASKGAAWDDQD
uniref:T-complex protein 1 subunit theta n=1 Tax=Aceria tosichella TaxID=561515 RepID=A0A6G1SPF8_9ACAR